MKPKAVIYGAGGHGRVIADIVRRAGSLELVGFIDDAAIPERFGLPVLGDREHLRREVARDTWIVLGIGHSPTRDAISRLVVGWGFQRATCVHPTAELGEGVSLGAGTVVMAHAVINPGTMIGEDAIVNTGATVDHDCRLGDLVHVSPGVHLAGNVHIGRGSHIGIGATVIQGVHIGDWVTIGASAAVVSRIPDGVTAMGVPARIVG